MKNAVLFLIPLSILWLGMSQAPSLFSGYRDPVPLTQKVAHSNHCSGCHGYDETGQALVDMDGNDVNIYDDWQISMMGLSAYDPFWRATLAHEVNQYPIAKNAIETTCLKCHAPLGSLEARLDQRPYAYADMLTDSLGLDGVSCSACHQQPAQFLGLGHSGNFTIDTNRILWGQYPNPFKGPMQIYVDFEPEFSDHIYSSGICAGCHTLITETLADDGSPTGNHFVEQATYHEWLNSSYPAQGKECQTCHMPFLEEGVIIATELLALEERHPYGLHQFFGANTAMLELMKAHRKELQLPDYFPGDVAWDETILNNRNSLQQAAQITTSTPYVFNDTLYVRVSVKNKTGHKLPSGYPSRLMWITVTLMDQFTGDTLYINGRLDAGGHIEGRDHPYEPHHEISRSPDDVQIYEMVMSDLQGDLTTRLNAAFEPFKDNRLVPAGFRQTHSVYDTVAIWGNALTDTDYTTHSTAGADTIEYRIPLEGMQGIGDLDVSLLYQSLPNRWMNDLFQHANVPEVGQFKSMFEGYSRHHEVMGQVRIDDIDLSTTSIQNPSKDATLFVFPNPVHTRSLHVSVPASFESGLHPIEYTITELRGGIVQSGTLSGPIELHQCITTGVYCLILSDQKKPPLVTRFVVL